MSPEQVPKEGNNHTGQPYPEQSSSNRAREKDHGITAGQRHGLTEGFFRKWTED
jgi:hypothetical protein